MLGEVGHVDVGADRARARHRGQVAQEQAHQGGLARSVRADQRQLLPPLQGEAHAGQDGRSVVADGHVVQFGHHPRGPAGRREPEAGHLGAMVRHLDAFELLERLDAALDLASLGRLVAEPFDEPLDVRHLPGLAACGGAGAGQPLLPLHDELGEPTHVLGRGPVRQLDDPLGHGVDEVAVVAHEEDGTRVGGQRVLEPRHAVRVEVVGGLVEDERVGLGQQQAAQRGAHPPPTGHLDQRAGGVGRGEAQPGQHAVGIGLHGVAPQGFEAALRVPVRGEGAVVLGPGCRRDLVVQAGQLPLESLDLRATGQDLVEHGAVTPLGDLLREVADRLVAGPVHFTRVRVDHAEHDLQQGRLAGAVSADQRDAPPGRELERDVAEQHPRAVALRQP